MSEQQMETRAAKIRQWVVWALFAGSLALYGATLSRGAFPGLPAKSLVWYLGLDSTPTLLGSMWGRLVRLWALLPGGSVGFWAGAFSAVFGAMTVAMTGWLSMRVRYPMHDKHDPDEVRREHQARVLSGVVAGLFAAVSIPIWILSTRSLPGAFHLLLLLGAAGLFSEYQRTGRNGYLYALGLLYGAGLAEFPTFLVFAPFTALLVIRAMLQRAAFRWSVLIRVGLCMVPGLLTYIWNGWTLWGDPAVRLRGFASLWSVIWYIWRDQWHLIVHAPQTGFALVLFLTVGPWAVLFLLRPKKPAWRYSTWQVLLRLVVLGAALLVVFNAPGSPWRFFGMNYLMATPYLILAACAGRVAGEFWVMGQVREHRNAGIGQPLRSAAGFFALLLTLAALVAGGMNWGQADGRPGTVVESLAQEALEALEGRDVVISNGVLDDSIRLLAFKSGRPLTVVSVPLAESGMYRDYLALTFDHPRQQALLQVGFSAFLQDFLARPEGLLRTGALDVADPLREFGYLVPDRLAYRAETSPEHVDLDQLMESQKAFGARLEAWNARPTDPLNPGRIYLDYIRRMASKVANNIGFSQVELGNTADAESLFHLSRQIDPDNISALLNLLTIAQSEDRPDVEAYLQEWENFKKRQVDSRVMWSLGSLYGYVHNTGILVRHGMMWAVTGKPRMAEAEMLRASKGQAVDTHIKAFLARAFLESGELDRSAHYYREILEDNPRDLKSLVMMAQLAIRSEAYPEAERLLDHAEASGLPAGAIEFERAILAYLQGHPEQAMDRLRSMVEQQREDPRALALLAMLTADGRDRETHARALKALQGLRGNSPDIRLMLAELFIEQGELVQARAEIEQVTRMNPRLIRAWEMLVRVDYQERKRELAEDHVRILLTLDSDNYTGNLMLASFQYGRGQYSLAESSYRVALAARREPVLLNDLAYLLMVRGNDLAEARVLIDEALAKQPGNALFLSTRSELNMVEGRLDEAERDLQQVLADMPNQAQPLLLAAQLYAARGQNAAALELATSLLDRQAELMPEQQRHLQALLQDVR